MIGLFSETSWIDVSIPLFAGLLLVVCPEWAVKSTGSAEKDETRQSLARKGGFLLLLVAAIYYLTTTLSVPVA